MAKAQSEYRTAIPGQIVFDILLLLPTKSLVQFKCVCKEWNSIINSSIFFKKHSENVSKNLTLGNNHRLIVSDSFSIRNINEKKFKVTRKKFRFPPNYNGAFYVFGSCNGILCVVFESGSIVLWNPCTREHKNLPLTCPANYDDGEFADSFGFGYDQSTDDYKVVRFYPEEKRDDSSGTPCEIYSLKTNSWRNMPDLPCNVGIHNSIQGTLLNSVLYWPVDQCIEDDIVEAILCFDLVQDQFDMLSLSHNLVNKGSVLGLGNFEGNLFMFLDYQEERSIDIWALDMNFSDLDGRKSNQWIKLTTVPYPANLSPYELIIPAHFTKNGDVLLVNSSTETLHLFSSEKKAFREFNIGYTSFGVQVIAYSETLISLKW